MDMNAITKDVEDTIKVGSFMSLRLEYTSYILEWINKTNQGWYTQKAD